MLIKALKQAGKYNHSNYAPGILPWVGLLDGDADSNNYDQGQDNVINPL